MTTLPDITNILPAEFAQQGDRLLVQSRTSGFFYVVELTAVYEELGEFGLLFDDGWVEWYTFDEASTMQMWLVVDAAELGQAA